MVKALLCMTLVITSVIFADIQVEVAFPPEGAVKDHPLEGFVTVSHPEDEAVNIHSFYMDSQPIQVEFVRDSIRSSLIIVNGVKNQNRSVCSIYRFFITPGDVGEQTVGPVSVIVGQRRYRSKPVSYTVYASESSRQFRMEAFVNTQGPVYPGQRVAFGYRFYRETPQQNREADLPLLEAEGFRKIGTRTFNNSVEEGCSVEEIVQEVEAVTPGEYLFGPSFAEVQPYQRDFFGRRLYEPRLLHADSGPIKVTVLPFPADNRPDSFNGALGEYSLDASLLSSDNLAVGDRIRLRIEVIGSGTLATVHLPDLARDPSFQQVFRLSDLPPQVEEFPDKKVFTVEMRPLSAEVTQIPPIAFSSFDPKTHQYHTAMSQPIPVNVAALPHPEVAIARDTVEVHADPAPLPLPPQEFKGRLMEISGCVALSVDALDRDRPPWWMMGVFPVSGVAWFAQWLVRERVSKRRRKKKDLTADALLKQAARHKERARMLQDLEAGLLLAVYENGYVADLPSSPDWVPLDGACGAVRYFIEQLHQEQYGARSHLANDRLTDEARRLYRRLKEEKTQ